MRVLHHRRSRPACKKKKDAKFASLVIVARPSGSGKSTFMEQLVEGRLPRGIRLALPGNCEQFVHVTRKEYLRQRTSPDETEAHGIVLHYDISTVWRSGLAGYEADPLFKILSRTSCITVVNIHVSAATLMRQHERRRRRKRLSSPVLRQALGGLVREVSQRLAQFVGGQRRAASLALLNDQHWLDRCYETWKTFVGCTIRALTNAYVVHVEPAPHRDDEPRFRLIPTME